MMVNANDLSNGDYIMAVEHITANARDVDIAEIACILGTDVDIKSFLLNEAMAAKSGAFLCFDGNDQPVAVGGIHVCHKGVGNAWLWATPRFDNHKFEVSRFVKKYAASFLQHHGHRIQCLTAAFHKNSHGWLEMAGLKREGVLVKYGSNGEDFYQFGITR